MLECHIATTSRSADGSIMYNNIIHSITYVQIYVYYLYYLPCNTLNSFAFRITYALLSDNAFSKRVSISKSSFLMLSFSFSNLVTLLSTEAVSKDRHINGFIDMKL